MLFISHLLLLLTPFLLLLPHTQARHHYKQEPVCQTPPLDAPIDPLTSASTLDCIYAVARLPLPKGDDRNPKDPDILIEGTLHTHAQYGTCRIEIFNSYANAPFVSRREVIDAVQSVLYTCANTAGRVKGKKQITPDLPPRSYWLSEVRVYPVVN